MSTTLFHSMADSMRQSLKHGLDRDVYQARNSSFSLAEAWTIFILHGLSNYLST